MNPKRSIVYGRIYFGYKIFKEIQISVISLREHLRIHESFIVNQNKSYFLHNYQKFSIKSYVVAIY